jgi:hypothetical protein
VQTHLFIVAVHFNPPGGARASANLLNLTRYFIRKQKKDCYFRERHRASRRRRSDPLRGRSAPLKTTFQFKPTARPRRSPYVSITSSDHGSETKVIIFLSNISTPKLDTASLIQQREPLKQRGILFPLQASKSH